MTHVSQLPKHALFSAILSLSACGAIHGASPSETGTSTKAEVYQLEDNFESPKINPSWTIENVKFGEDKNINLIPDPVSPGNQVVSLVNNFTDTPPSNARTEMTSSHGEIVWDHEYWVGFRFNLKDWKASKEREAVHQFHGVPGNYAWADTWAGRNITTLDVRENTLGLYVIGKPLSGPATKGAHGERLAWSAPVEANRWYHWVFHLRPSLKDDGLIEAWVDGKKVLTQNGPNVDQYDSKGNANIPKHYLKIGVYNWPWAKGPCDITRREILYDDVRIGHVEGGYTGGYKGVDSSVKREQ